MKKILFLLFTVTALFSCKKDNNTTVTPQNVDYLIIGNSTCFCYDCCKTGYKIAGEQLYQGERSEPDVYVFENAPLPAAKYAIAKVLLDEFPEQLLGQNGESWGCGGCADQPVFYVELKKDGVVYKWHIDSVTDGFPDHVKAYSAHLSEVMNQLQQ